MRPNCVVLGALWSSSGWVLGFLGDLDQRIGEGIQRVLVLGLGRLDHQRLVDDEREVVRRRVELVVHQPLGDIQGADVAAFEASFRHELMHADTVIWYTIGIAQSCQQIVGVQHGILGDILEPIRSVHGDVGERPDEAAAEMAVEGFHSADGFLQA